MAKILVAANDSTEREGLALVLEFAGHRCETARSFQEAMDLLRNDSFDTVVTDCSLRDYGCNQIVNKMKSASPSIAVMVLSESGGAVPEDADDVLAIPCSLENLLLHIRDLLA